MTAEKRFPAPYPADFSGRDPAPGVDPCFPERWSPRAFRKTEIPTDVLTAIVDAARWSMSCFNEQPWLIVTSTADTFPVFLKLLNDRNLQWAADAGVLGFILGRRNFSEGGKPNRWSWFDCGAAWMALTLQANAFGLYTHGMAGIKRDEVCSRLNLDADTYEAICGFALGAIDTPDKLPETFREGEKPSARRGLGEIWKEGI